MVFDNYSKNDVKRRYLTYNCHIEPYVPRKMDTSDKDPHRKNVEKVKPEGSLPVKLKYKHRKSKNHDYNIMCDSFTYLCTMAHLEPLLKSAWWMNSNQQNQEIESDQYTADASSSIPSTSSAGMAEYYAVAEAQQLGPEVTVTPFLKRPLIDEDQNMRYRSFGADGSAPSTSSAGMTEYHTVTDVQQLRPEVTVTPSHKRSIPPNGTPEVPVKKRRFINN